MFLGAAVLLCLWPVAHAGALMFFGKKVTVYPFSGFEGQILYQGQPAAYAKVKRTYDWDGTLHEETVETDEQGKFSFDSVSVETRLGISQFVSAQDIYVDYKGKTTEIWTCGKIEEEEFGEFGGEPEEFICELTNDQKAMRLPRGAVGTNCVWKTKDKIWN